MDGLTKEEAAIYDRQLRVWGVEAQQRLRNSRVLVGGCTGAAHEVTKNLALAGVGMMVLVDRRTLREDHGSFLIPSDKDEECTSISQLCAEGLKEMNPLVKLKNIDMNPFEYLESADLKEFDAVIVFDMAAHLISKADSLCSDLGVPFASCNGRGTCGWIFLNPQDRKYVVEESSENDRGEIKKNYRERETSGLKFDEVIKQLIAANPRRKSPLFETLKECINYEINSRKSATLEEYDDLLVKLQGSDGSDDMKSTALFSYLSEKQGLPAIHAVLGGILANDVIKIVSKKGDLSVDKLFMYSILDDGGWTGF